MSRRWPTTTGSTTASTGLRDSLAAAKRYRFPVVGIGLNAKQAYRPFRRTINGQRIAVIGATQVLDDHLISSWTAGPGQAGPRVGEGRADGSSRRSAPHARRPTRSSCTSTGASSSSSAPRPTSARSPRQLVAAGADVVVGGHAHRVQGAGRMGKALVGYGLGNFVWYGTSELSTQTGVLLVTVDGRRVLALPLGARAHRRRRPAARSPEPSDAARSSSWRALRGCTGLRP